MLEQLDCGNREGTTNIMVQNFLLVSKKIMNHNHPFWQSFKR
ncbi:unnamed protein product [Brassica oleracea var. botrytis]